ncbi:MAG: DNA repair protein RecO [Saccharofermentanales bacterium]
MDPLRIKGIILREVPVGEADKILTILTREAGLISVSAKNARRPKSNMLVSTSALVFGEFELFGSESTRYYLHQATIIEPFTKLREDIVLLTYCAHLMDVILDAMRDSSASDDVYTLLLYTLNNICKPDRDIGLIVHTFELKLLFLIGFMPILDSCFVCKNKMNADTGQQVLFSYTHCGVCCNNISCVSKAGDYKKISPATWNCMLYIASAPIDKLYSFTLDEICSREICDLAARYICDRLERCYTKLDMLKEF